MKSLASVSINYRNYRVIMPDYSGTFFLMQIRGDSESESGSESDTESLDTMSECLRSNTP